MTLRDQHQRGFTPVLRSVKVVRVMLAQTLLPFLLFTASFATPSRRQTDCIPSQDLYLPSSQTTITRPDETLQFVTLGIGRQNYTCSSQGTYT
jgi:hypothetical protein